MAKKFLIVIMFHLQIKKIQDVDEDIEQEYQQWASLSNAERAFHIYSLMLGNDGKSSLKAIVAQCFASILKWNISDIPEKITKEKMFDLDLYRYQIKEEKEKFN